MSFLFEPVIVLAVVIATLPGVVRIVGVVGDWLENRVEHSGLKDTFHRLG